MGRGGGDGNGEGETGRGQWEGGDLEGVKGRGEKRILYIVSSTRLHQTVTHNICL